MLAYVMFAPMDRQILKHSSNIFSFMKRTLW